MLFVEGGVLLFIAKALVKVSDCCFKFYGAGVGAVIGKLEDRYLMCLPHTRQEMETSVKLLHERSVPRRTVVHQKGSLKGKNAVVMV